MHTFLGISGSTRAGSYNSMLLRALAQTAPAGVTVEVVSIKGIPLYDGDGETAHGIPDVVRELKDQLAAASGLLLVTPEYNNSLPGGLKNAIDWMSRPAADIARVFGGRPVAIAGATPGPGGTLLAQAAWLPVIRTLGMRPWFPGRLSVSGAAKIFDANGTILDPAIQARVATFIAGFASFVAGEEPSR